MVRLPRNEKQTYRMNSKASNVTIRFDLGHDFDLEISRSNMKFAISQPKRGPIATKRKANISIELQASNVTNGFDLDHSLYLWILNVKCDLDLWPHTWPWPWIFMVKFWNSCISEWEGWLTLHKGGGSRSFMTMTMTIWWPGSGVWIYQIVTGVTSVVGVLSTHLVYLICMYVLYTRIFSYYTSKHLFQFEFEWKYMSYLTLLVMWVFFMENLYIVYDAIILA